MSSNRLAPQRHPLLASEVRVVSVDFSGLLDEGETLASVSSVTDGSGLLAISGTQVNTVEMKINGTTVPIGHAATFQLDHNGAAAGEYVLGIECVTSASQEVVGGIHVRVY